MIYVYIYIYTVHTYTYYGYYGYSINIIEMLLWAAGWETKPEKARPTQVDSTECPNAWW